MRTFKLLRRVLLGAVLGLGLSGCYYYAGSYDAYPATYYYPGYYSPYYYRRLLRTALLRRRPLLLRWLWLSRRLWARLPRRRLSRWSPLGSG